MSLQVFATEREAHRDEVENRVSVRSNYDRIVGLTDLTLSCAATALVPKP